jgi:alkylresorcinol/alkylpyrone synthase
MPYILSIGTENPPYKVNQEDTQEFAKHFFSKNFEHIDRLLPVFHNGQIESRYFSAPLEWFQSDHSFQEKNDKYIKVAVEHGKEVINKALSNKEYLNETLPYEDIDAIIYISTTGLSTPSIEARLMNQLPFRPTTKRIPIWGLGCAGGAAGLARAYEYCQAFKEATVLVLCVELCSLTFQYGDRSKSNLIGTSLFADGLAAVVVAGKESPHLNTAKKVLPRIVHTQTTLMPNSESVMGWEIRNDGLFVVFDKSIPAIVESWFKGVASGFLQEQGVTMADLTHFIAHPGGRKVLEAYQSAFGLQEALLLDSYNVLRDYGNMSSPTVLFVLEKAMKKAGHAGELGIAASLGPGFSSELVLLKWEEVS